jgi:hypothetical protein
MATLVKAGRRWDFVNADLGSVELAGKGITQHLGLAAKKIERRDQQITLSNGANFYFARLIFDQLKEGRRLTALFQQILLCCEYLIPIRLCSNFSFAI